MTEGMASEIAKEKMRDLGLKRKHYLLRYKFLRIDGLETRVLKAANDLFLVIDVPKGIKVKSKTGVYDLADIGITEMQHVHSGTTTVTNITKGFIDIKLLQVIPKIKK
ncbi:MAG: hypothetical protein Crog4KO_06730 [Crocinitomicaceae bacterium]